jgi:hypothetical protein
MLTTGFAQGTSHRALQEWMGHGSIKVTMDIYGHLFPDEHDRARAAMNAAFTDRTGSGDNVLTRNRHTPTGHPGDLRLCDGPASYGNMCKITTKRDTPCWLAGGIRVLHTRVSELRWP